jgi:hypothetical protein
MENKMGELRWKLSNGTKTFLGICGIFGFMMSMALSTGYIERSENPPTDRLTLTEPGCQYLVQTGIGIEMKSGICSINVKYRKNHFNNGGVIEQLNEQPIEISDAQVVAVKEIDDGSKEPWSLRLWLTLVWFAGSALAMMGSAFLLNGKSSASQKNTESQHSANES